MFGGVIELVGYSGEFFCSLSCGEIVGTALLLLLFPLFVSKHWSFEVFTVAAAAVVANKLKPGGGIDAGRLKVLSVTVADDEEEEADDEVVDDADDDEDDELKS